MFFLHLSDMHFGISQNGSEDETESAIRSNYMDELAGIIYTVSQNKRIDFILITGDIAWKAAAGDYRKAENWLKNVMRRCGISSDRLLLCPGNHDVEREDVEALKFPADQKTADKYLRVEKLDRLQLRFEQYIEFFHHMNLTEYTIGSRKSPLVGNRDMGDFRVICLNTAWYAQGDVVKDKMWVGSGLVEVIKRDLSRDKKKPNIVIMHHPHTSWNEEERCDFGHNTNVLREVCEMADIVLSGHTHETNGLNINMGNALVASSGAIYQEKRYPHCFYAYEIDFTGQSPEQKRIRYYYSSGQWDCMEQKITLPGDKKRRGNLKTEVKGSRYIETGAIEQENIVTQSNLFCIAGKTIRFLPIICSWNDKEDEYCCGDIETFNEEISYKIPQDIYECFLQAANEPEDILENVYEEKVRIDNYSVKIMGGNQPHKLIFNFSKAAYKDFLIVKTVMDQLLEAGGTVRSKYFNYMQSLITNELPNVCGVGIFIITSDDKILISRSSKNVAVNPDRYIYTASGSMNWAGKDTNPFFDIIRECEEEIGYAPSLENLKLYSFGIDYDSGYYQFSFYERTDRTAQELMENVSMARDFHIELQTIIAVDFDYKSVWKLIKENRWDETAKANLITLIVKKFGKQTVEKHIDPNRKKKNFRRQVIQEWERRAQREGRLAVLSNRYPAAHISRISEDYYKKVISFIDDDLTEKTVIEVGGGIGLFTKYFAEHAGSVTCVDVSKGMLQRNREFLGESLARKVNYVNCFFQDYQENLHFDLLICSLVLIHNADELQEIVSNMKRIADTIYLFEHVEDGALASRYTEPKTQSEYIGLFPEYDVEKTDSHMLFTDKIACIKLVRRR